MSDVITEVRRILKDVRGPGFGNERTEVAVQRLACDLAEAVALLREVLDIEERCPLCAWHQVPTHEPDRCKLAAFLARHS